MRHRWCRVRAGFAALVGAANGSEWFGEATSSDCRDEGVSRSLLTFVAAHPDASCALALEDAVGHPSAVPHRPWDYYRRQRDPLVVIVSASCGKRELGDCLLEQVQDGPDESVVPLRADNEALTAECLWEAQGLPARVVVHGVAEYLVALRGLCPPWAGWLSGSAGFVCALSPPWWALFLLELARGQLSQAGLP